MIPEINDTVQIQSENYTGPAIVTYINHPDLYNHHLFPIQVEISKENLNLFADGNDGHTIYRTNLQEIKMDHQPVKQEEEPDPFVEGRLFW